MEGDNMQWAMVSPSSGKLQMKRIPIPVPGNGQVLIEVHAAPLNPSDIYCLKGKYDHYNVFEINYPLPNGTEGSGKVVKSGGGFMANRAVGSRVSFVRHTVRGNEFEKGGSYQQYAVVDAINLIYLPQKISYDVGSTYVVNPLSAFGLVEDATKVHKAKAIVQTAACSQLGRMVIVLCQQKKIPLINIVRREEQVKMLTEEYNCKYVLNSTSETFKEDLTKLAEELKATVLLEAVGGSTPADLMLMMPQKSKILIYGLLSEQSPCGFDPLILISKQYEIIGWVLTDFMRRKGLGVVSVIKQCGALMQNEKFQTKIQKHFKLNEFRDHVDSYFKNMTGGKFILTPQEIGDDWVDGDEFDITDLGAN